LLWSFYAYTDINSDPPWEAQDWVWDQSAARYVLDEDMARRLKESNPEVRCKMEETSILFDVAYRLILYTYIFIYI